MSLLDRIRKSRFMNPLYDAQVSVQSRLFPPPPKGRFPPLCLTTPKPPYGLLAKGGELSAESLLEAYRKGIFGFHAENTVFWWSCNPRMVLFPEETYFNKRFRKQLRSDRYTVTFDTAFDEVLEACAGRETTWLTPERKTICRKLHAQGLAHSAETRNKEGQLVGGVFGTSLGTIFIGESSFHTEPSASKVALITLACHLQHWGFSTFDIGGYQPYLEPLGFRSIPRKQYLKLLKTGVSKNQDSAPWRIDEALDPSIWKPAEPGSQIRQ